MMATPTPQEIQADQDAFSKQYDAEQAAKAQQEQQAKQPPSFLQQWAGNVGHVTLNMLDSAVSAAERMYTESNNEESGMVRQGRNIAAGAITGATNIADSAVRLGESTVQNVEDAFAPRDPRQAAIAQSIASESDAAAARQRWMDSSGAPTSPIWDHAKSAILDFRDAIAVKDPTVTDQLVQSVAQLAIPFAGFSRALAGLHGFASALAAGGLTDATALQPHDMRTADLISLGQQTEGKLGQVLRAMGPYGLNAYVRFLTDRTDEGEAEGRFKNALDGLGANTVLTPLLHSVGVVLKQGMPALRYAAENFGGGPLPGGLKAQAGKIVFHGTPHDFDEFDSSKIGTGEGNQSFGHGLYFAENKGVAGGYQQRLTGRANGGQGLLMSYAQDAVNKAGGDAVKAYKQLSSMAANEQSPDLRSTMQRTAELIRSGNYNRATGKLMHVDIADEHLNNMLDYDKPLTEQPEILKKLTAANEQFSTKGNGADLLKELGGGEAASMRLQQAGIPGIRYFDGASRGSGGGTRNVVLFDAKHAKIVRKE